MAVPFSHPSAAVVDPVVLAFNSAALKQGTLIPNGRSRPADDGVRWLVYGWRIFRAQPLGWWSVMLVGLGFIIGISFFPIVGVLGYVLSPAFTAGFGSCARSVTRGHRFGIHQVVDGFRLRPAALLMVGVMFVVLKFTVLASLISAFGGSPRVMDFYLGSLAGQHEALTHLSAKLGSGFVICRGIADMLLPAPTLYAPYLIMEHGSSAPGAMWMSIRGVFKNVPALLMGLATVIVLSILATFPFFFGWLALIPVVVLSTYAGYRDIFISMTD